MPKIPNPKPKTIGIVGSRRRDEVEDYDAMVATFDAIYREGDRIVSGGCLQGGDKFTWVLARKRGLTITTHFPNWTLHGNRAGFVRNSFIARDCDVLIALVHEDRTGGTEDTVKKCLKLKKQVILA